MLGGIVFVGLAVATVWLFNQACRKEVKMTTRVIMGVMTVIMLGALTIVGMISGIIGR